MVDRELIIKKLQELNRYLKELEASKNISFDEFRSSIGKQWMVCHGIQLSIQSLIDVGNHILAALGENQIEDYSDIIDKLGERNILPPEFAQSIRGMVGLRNILVHEYARLNIKTIYDILQNQLEDFHKFTQHINQFLNR